MPVRRDTGKRRILRPVIYVMAGIIGVSVLLRLFIFEIYRVDGKSMQNAFFDGNSVFINKLKNRNIERNDVVVFRAGGKVYIKRCIGLPGETVEIKKGKVFIDNREIRFPVSAILPDTTTTSSSAGVPDIVMFDKYGKYWDLNNFGPYTIPGKGMTISLTPGNLKLYNSMAGEHESFITANSEKKGNGPALYTFQDNYYFFLGDNRPVSGDSRTLGAISESAVVGKVEFAF